MIPVWTVDFETLPIGPRPDHYPPKPTGVSIRHIDGTSRYYAWGHPTGNNCSWEDAARVLRAVWAEDRPVVFHNAKFDLAVAYEHFGLPELPWQRVHDTMFLAFLLGWAAHWLFHRFNRVNTANVAEIDQLASQLHDAEETRDEAIAYLQGREAELTGRLGQTEAELEAAMEGLGEARREVEELRDYIDQHLS